MKSMSLAAVVAGSLLAVGCVINGQAGAGPGNPNNPPPNNNPNLSSPRRGPATPPAPPAAQPADRKSVV